ncbi:TetR family transcriptional regulator [Bifidobacterium callitrichos]|uniref:TetR family transcriptional regulator n=1 Tax=Bifidobacterium callitrichos TaxID=762209 RepID=A0A5M9ZDK6_9BIFI|nr:TetR/AcrR family transcriptional regulator [Bifidobacterium callitrichos]KAA8817210.1 TetR family transcriptional regulator [Bifidobacterium callitrichos]
MAENGTGQGEDAMRTTDRQSSQRGVSVKAAVARTRWQRRKRMATRRTIRDTAMRLFDEYGYDAVTTQRIAAEAGMSQITLFRYFPSKEDLVIGLPADGELFADLRRELGARKDASPVAFARRVIPQVLGSVESDQLEELAARLRIVRSNEALLAALYARVPRWTSAVAREWGSAGSTAVMPSNASAVGDGSVDGGDDVPPVDFAVRLSISCLIDSMIETLLEWSHRCESEQEDKADLLVTIVSEAMATVLH